MPRGPFGTWPSPIRAEDLLAGSIGVGFPVQAGPRLLWQESRPDEAGRVAIVSLGPDGTVADVLPAEMSARTAVHEYGGLCWAAGGPGGRVVVSVDHSDQRLWLIEPGPCRPLTPEPDEPGTLRYGAPVISPDGAWVIAVRESHGTGVVDNDIIAVPTLIGDAGRNDTTSTLPRVVAEGHDFYSWPVLSGDGRQLAYVSWDLPDMPWDATQLHVSGFEVDGEPASRSLIGGKSSSVVQPKWWSNPTTGETVLEWISDATGWWSPYRQGDALCSEEADFAAASWGLGDSSYARTASGALLATWRSGGRNYLGTISAGRTVAFDLPFTEFSHLSPYGTALLEPNAGPASDLPGEEGALAMAAGPYEPSQLVAISTDGQWTVLKRSRPAPQRRADVSVGEHFSFPTTGGARAHAFFFPPVLGGWQGLDGELPPLIVTGHGGPTGQASSAYEPRTQFWTTRGFAVVDVDYRGSTGYGRSYRQALDGQWGVSDVDDYVAAARWLCDNGKTDANRVVVRGSSSSGLTVLAALARYSWLRAGVARYPVCDLAETLQTHKFESRYVERLVPADQVQARSPLHFAAQIKAPVLFMHGTDDRVVPCASTRRMAYEMRAHGAEPGLVVLEGEGHGFRQAQNAVRSQLLELAFVREALGIPAAAHDEADAQADLRRCLEPGGAFWPSNGTR